MRKRVNEAETPQRTVQMLGEDNQPMLLPGASSSGFADFIVCTSENRLVNTLLC